MFEQGVKRQHDYADNGVYFVKARVSDGDDDSGVTPVSDKLLCASSKLSIC